VLGKVFLMKFQNLRVARLDAQGPNYAKNILIFVKIDQWGLCWLILKVCAYSKKKKRRKNA